MERTQAFVNFLECDVEDVGYDENVFNYGSEEYLVLTDEEADIQVKEYIKESVWAFNSSFLAVETEIDEEVFSVLSNKCESGNDAILSLIEKTCGIDEFVDSAVSADGRGHFLSPYNGIENEEGEYFIYRLN